MGTSEVTTQSTARPKSDQPLGMVRRKVRRKGDDVIRPFHPSAPLARLVERFVDVIAKLLKLDAGRKNISATVERMPAAARQELERQERELERFPTVALAERAMDKVQTQLDELKQKLREEQFPEFCIKVSEAEKKVIDKKKGKVKIRIGGGSSKKEEPKEEPLDPAAKDDELVWSNWDGAYRKILEIGLIQCRLFILREQLMDQILPAAAQEAARQPLYKVMQRHELDPVPVYGWLVFILMLEQIQSEAEQMIQQINEEVKALDEDDQQNMRGIMALLSSRQQSENVVETRLKKFEIEQRCILEAARRQLNQCERPSSAAFWELYQQLSKLWVRDDLSETERLPIRMFLRYGLVGTSTWIAKPSIIQFIIDDCTENVIREYDCRQEATHVLYTDEYLLLVCQGQITPAANEDLELNHRNSPEWRQDKHWRLMVGAKVQLTIFNERREQLLAQVDQLSAKSTKAKEIFERHRERKSRRLQQVRDYGKDCLALSVRFKKYLTQFDDQFIPQAEQRLKDNEAKLDGTLTPEILAERESDGIHRACRLGNKLKEPFLPLALRDGFKLSQGTVNTRALVLDTLGDLERRDPLIFKEEVIKNNRKQRRIYIRYSPYVLLTPGIGLMGMSMAPRDTNDPGRLAFPGYTVQPNMLQIMMWNCFSDYRWDTAIASAGMDVMNSNTICAAYGAVRWQYRNKSKGARLRAGIQKDRSDRDNFRRHYRLYVGSAYEGGKKLFFKCFEVYHAFMQYFDLPEGVKKLERA